VKGTLYLLTSLLFGTTLASAATFDLQAHRGGRGLWPENTLAAFAHSLELGVRTLELDCAVTKDEVVVVSHDSVLNPNITRDAHGSFLTAEGPALHLLTYAQLQAYDVGRLRPDTPYSAAFPDQKATDGERIPRLADLYSLVSESGNREVRFNVETKLDPTQPQLTVAPEAFVEAIVKVIRQAGMVQRTTIQSFDWRTLSITHKVEPALVTVGLTDQQPDDDTVQVGKPGASPWLGGLDVDDFGGSVPRAVKANGSRVWSPNYRDLHARVVEEAHALGLGVIPWTVNEARDMERMIALRVDGIITDRPDLLRAVLEAKGIAVPSPMKLPAKRSAAKAMRR
jgi:glycerophosphoryl diester phosphodiesterase